MFAARWALKAELKEPSQALFIIFSDAQFYFPVLKSLKAPQSNEH